ncbi:hypothetical protein D3C80_860220 [compost metagenome]
MEKSAMYIMKNAEIIDTGMATNGIIVLLQSRKKIKMMIDTSTKASIRVSSTSESEFRTGTVKSFPRAISYSLGAVFLISSNRFLNSSTMARELAPRCGITPVPTPYSAVLPL